MSTKIQSLLFSRRSFTPAQAKRWVKKHGYVIPKIHTTENYLRVRQLHPDLFKRGTLRTRTLKEGVKAITGVLKAPKKNFGGRRHVRNRVEDKVVSLEALESQAFQRPPSGLSASERRTFLKERLSKRREYFRLKEELEEENWEDYFIPTKRTRTRQKGRIGQILGTIPLPSLIQYVDAYRERSAPAERDAVSEIRASLTAANPLLVDILAILMDKALQAGDLGPYYGEDGDIFDANDTVTAFMKFVSDPLNEEEVRKDLKKIRDSLRETPAIEGRGRSLFQSSMEPSVEKIYGDSAERSIHLLSPQTYARAANTGLRTREALLGKISEKEYDLLYSALIPVIEQVKAEKPALIISCAANKLTQEPSVDCPPGQWRAIELYTGPMWTTYRNTLKKLGVDPFRTGINPFNVYIMSAEFGIIPADQCIPEYDSVLQKVSATGKLTDLKKVKKLESEGVRVIPANDPDYLALLQKQFQEYNFGNGNPVYLGVFSAYAQALKFAAEESIEQDRGETDFKFYKLRDSARARPGIGTARQALREFIEKNYEESEVAPIKELMELPKRAVQPVEAPLCPLPQPLHFASGSNEPGEILGWADLGYAVGVAAPECITRHRLGCSRALEAVSAKCIPVFVDSGAIKEATEGKEITRSEWIRRLDFYNMLSQELVGPVFFVAPDKIADQAATLKRLRTYNREMARLVKPPKQQKYILVVIQPGPQTLIDFYESIKKVVTYPFIPAFPMRQQVLRIPGYLDQFEAFLAQYRPPRVHLLGISPRTQDRKAWRKILDIMAQNPYTDFQMDSRLVGSSKLITGEKAAREKGKGLLTVERYAMKDLVFKEFARRVRLGGEWPQWMVDIWGNPLPDWEEGAYWFVSGLEPYTPGKKVSAQAKRIISQMKELQERRGEASGFFNEQNFLKSPLEELGEDREDRGYPQWYEDDDIEDILFNEWQEELRGTINQAAVRVSIGSVFKDYAAFMANPTKKVPVELLREPVPDYNKRIEGKLTGDDATPLTEADLAESFNRYFRTGDES